LDAKNVSMSGILKYPRVITARTISGAIDHFRQLVRLEAAPMPKQRTATNEKDAARTTQTNPKTNQNGTLAITNPK
jgi:hypothetical protein